MFQVYPPDILLKPVEKIAQESCWVVLVLPPPQQLLLRETGASAASRRADGIEARGIASTLERLIGPDIEGIIGTFFGGGSSGTALNARFSLPSGLITGALKSLGEGAPSSAALAGLEKLLGGGSSSTATAAAPAAFHCDRTDASDASRRAFSDLSDDEVNQLLEYVGTKAARSVSLNDLD
ncbi:hypothetical protein C8R44DRAFT_753805 [Mycena epipterygia]|nr:hypothetical protein C8R44DRAFT_753805 [Mycena epipterygia]